MDVGRRGLVGKKVHWYGNGGPDTCVERQTRLLHGRCFVISCSEELRHRKSSELSKPSHSVVALKGITVVALALSDSRGKRIDWYVTHCRVGDCKRWRISGDMRIVRAQGNVWCIPSARSQLRLRDLGPIRILFLNADMSLFTCRTPGPAAAADKLAA